MYVSGNWASGRLSRLALQFTDTATSIAVGIVKQAAQESNEELAIRIYLAHGCGCSVQYGMALDEPNENDEILDLGAFKVIFDKDSVAPLMETAKVDYVKDGLNEGFVIDAPKPATGGCGCGHNH